MKYCYNLKNFLRNRIYPVSKKICHIKQMKRMEETCGFHFMVEKIPNYGEDSEPIYLKMENNTFAVAVFDGLGGSGAAKCKSEYGEDCTKAYIASRIIRDCVENILKTEEKVDEQILHDKIKERLEREVNSYSSTKSILRSSIARDYPTTMALMIAHRNDDDDSTTIDSYWAGDSRNYLWTKKGLYQLSIDDIQSGEDAMENLHNDSRVSNCICADQSFKINHRKVDLKKNEPCILLSATDGCFGYYPSPMHFEAVLKDALKQADSYEEWKELVLRHITEVTGDDISLSLLTIPQCNFKEVKKNMAGDVKRFQEITVLESDIKVAEELLAEGRSKYQPLLQDIWEEYKQEYENYIKSDENA